MKIDLNFQFDNVEEFRNAIICLLHNDDKMMISVQQAPDQHKDHICRQTINPTENLPDTSIDIAAAITSQEDKFKVVESALIASKKPVKDYPVGGIHASPEVKTHSAPKPKTIKKTSENHADIKTAEPEIILVKCIECGKEYEKNPRTKYCSKHCTKKVANRNYKLKKAVVPADQSTQEPSGPDQVPEPAVNDQKFIDAVPSAPPKKVDVNKQNEMLKKLKKENPIQRDPPEIQHYF